MVERDSCYFCTSPFQLFAIISLGLSRKEHADLYIDPQFNGAEAFAERLRKTNIFENVTVINSSAVYSKYLSAGPGFLNHLQIANSYLHVRDIAGMILLPGVRYRNIFISSKAYIPRMVQLSYIRENWDLNVYYFDDGAGTYYHNRAHQAKLLDELLRRLLFKMEDTENEKLNYVFSKEIFIRLNEEKEEKTEPLIRFWENEDGKKLVNEVFAVNEKPEIKEKLIILDQPKKELLSLRNIEKINAIYNTFAEKIGYENTIIKPHPREKERAFEGISYLDNNGIPFEIYCLNVDMSDKIIITHSSTAAATPKILFNQEPKVVVLSKIIETSAGEEGVFADFFGVVKHTYSDVESFFIPENMGEVHKAINLL